MKYEAVIFDFNGVLFWDSHLHDRAWKKFSKKLRGYPLTSEEMVTQVHGKINKAILEYVLNRSISSQELKDLALQKEAIYQKLCLENKKDFKLSLGATELLDFLVEKDISHTIATASDKGNLDFFIRHFKLDKWFDISKIVYDDGLSVNKYEMFLKAAKNLEVLPEKCVVIEDSKSGIEAANKAKIGKIIGLGPLEMHGFLLGLKGVDEVVFSLNQINRGIFF